jgi:hypothetical protein
MTAIPAMVLQCFLSRRSGNVDAKRSGCLVVYQGRIWALVASQLVHLLLLH